jgi:hypothetical protein
MHIEDSDEQSPKVSDSIRRSLEVDSNVTSARDLQREKLFGQRISTQLGIQINESDEQLAKASPSIRESFESDSNLTSRRDWHHWKAFDPSF